MYKVCHNPGRLDPILRSVAPGVINVGTEQLLHVKKYSICILFV